MEKAAGQTLAAESFHSTEQHHQWVAPFQQCSPPRSFSRRLQTFSMEYRHPQAPSCCSSCPPCWYFSEVQWYLCSTALLAGSSRYRFEILSAFCLFSVKQKLDCIGRKDSKVSSSTSLPVLKTAQKKKKRLCFPWQINIRDLRGKQKVTLVVNKNLIKTESDNDNEVVVYWLIPTLVWNINRQTFSS